MQHVLRSHRLVILFSCLLTRLAGCNNDNAPDRTENKPEPTTATAAGNAQNGPFQSGGTATAFKLQADGTPSGTDVPGDIAANGALDLADIDWTGPTQLEVTSLFLNESTGNSSMGGDASARLRAVVAPPDDAETNVNLFTHFITARIGVS